MRNFRDLEVWTLSRSLVKEVYFLMKTMPEEEKFGLTSQIKRSVVQPLKFLSVVPLRKEYLYLWQT